MNSKIVVYRQIAKIAKISTESICFRYLLIAFISCSQEDDLNEMFLDKIENVIWTRGTNFKTFRSNPFKLFIIEKGIELADTTNKEKVKNELSQLMDLYFD